MRIPESGQDGDAGRPLYVFTRRTEDGAIPLGDGTTIIYANALLEADGTAALAAIAAREENSLVLLTCENESAAGGYLNRRAVFAKPME